MTPLRGLGVWIWQLPLCSGGNVDKIIAKFQQARIEWGVVKMGSSRSGQVTANGQLTADLIHRFADGGITLGGWWYSTPQSSEDELAMVTELLVTTGVRHLVLDAETEWESVKGPAGRIVSHDWRREAAEFARKLRDICSPDIYLADAPWPIRSAHPWFPFEEFGNVMNARMPQAYYAAAELDGAGNGNGRAFLERMDRQWGPENPVSIPVCPVLSPVNGNGTRHAPLGELAEFERRYQARPARSIWDYQHLLPEEWAILMNRSEGPAAPRGAP